MPHSYTDIITPVTSDIIDFVCNFRQINCSVLSGLENAYASPPLTQIEMWDAEFVPSLSDFFQQSIMIMLYLCNHVQSTAQISP